MAVENAPQPPPQPRLTVFEFAGAGVGLLSLAWAGLAALRLGPHFAGMFKDFGGTLPALTVLFLSRPFTVGLGLTPGALVALSVAFKGSLRTRAVMLAAAVLIAFAAPALFLLSMYLPIFALASAIK